MCARVHVSVRACACVCVPVRVCACVCAYVCLCGPAPRSATLGGARTPSRKQYKPHTGHKLAHAYTHSHATYSTQAIALYVQRRHVVHSRSCALTHLFHVAACVHTLAFVRETALSLSLSTACSLACSRFLPLSPGFTLRRSRYGPEVVRCAHVKPRNQLSFTHSLSLFPPLCCSTIIRRWRRAPAVAWSWSRWSVSQRPIGAPPSPPP